MALVPDYRVATLVAGIITLVAGAAIVAIAPRAPLHRATGLFFGLRGAFLTLTAFSRVSTDLQGRLLVYALLGIPFAAIWMAHRLTHDFGRRKPAKQSRAVSAFLVGGVAVCTTGYALDHDLFYDGPLLSFFELQFLTYAAITWVIAREMRRRPDGPSRRALYTFMLGFAAEPAYWATYLVLHGPIADANVSSREVAFAVASLVIILAAILWTANLRADARERAPAVVLLATAVGTAILTNIDTAHPFAPRYVLELPTVNAAWTLWTVCATAYASARYRLFDMDLQVKAFLRYGSTTFLLALVFWAASEILENQLNANSLWQSLAAAAAVGIALWPLQRVMQRLVERLMPGVARTEEYRLQRREEIYVAAVERARRDGFVDAGERDALRMLGHGLGLSGRDMARLETPVTSASS